MERLSDLIKQQVNITDYARYSGFTLVKKGKYYSLKEHDSVIIDPRKNCFWQNSVAGTGGSIGRGGSVIDFAVHMNNLSAAAAIKELRAWVDYKNSKPVAKQEIAKRNKTLNLPPKAGNMKRVFAYLIQTRCIAPSVICYPRIC